MPDAVIVDAIRTPVGRAFAAENHLRVAGLRIPGLAFLGSDSRAAAVSLTAACALACSAPPAAGW